MERHGFDVVQLAVEEIISEEWRVPTVHVFELRVRNDHDANRDAASGGHNK